MNLQKAPFPWYGGKSKAAPAVWAALGDVNHYVEPFAGSLAVLLNRPHTPNRAYHSETVNDLDGFVVNAWRAIAYQPEATAIAASWPVTEADLTARHIALVRWRAEHDLERLMGDPEWCDPTIAGWWLWGIAAWIGSGWCSGIGAWTSDEDGRAYRQARNSTREPGVSRKLPHLANNGRGVNNAALREPGVSRKLPHLADDGRGVNRPALREPGVTRQLPHLTSDGQGVNRPALRDHPTGLIEWFGWLAARLRHVRIVNGDWRRVLTQGAAQTLNVRVGDGTTGIFLDPPYADTADRKDDLYAVDSLTVAHDVREWCLANGENPKYRIVLAGFDGEHGTDLTDAGWQQIEWFTTGWLNGGMGDQQHRERLWASPHCLRPDTNPQTSLFDLLDEGTP